MARRTETLYEPRRCPTERAGYEGKDGYREKRLGPESYTYTKDVKVDATTPRNDLETSFAPFLLLPSTNFRTSTSRTRHAATRNARTRPNPLTPIVQIFATSAGNSKVERRSNASDKGKFLSADNSSTRPPQRPRRAR